MNTFKCLLLTAVASFALTGCQPAANTAMNSNAKPANIANSNSNANSTASAAPTKESLMALETKANEAWKTHDLKFWDTFLSSKYSAYSKDGKIGKADVAKMMETEKCEVKSYSLSEDQMTQLGPDAAMLTYKNAQDATCNGQKVPANVWVSTIFVREGGEWKALFHGEAPLPDPNAKPAAPAKPADTAAKASPAANSSPAATTAPDAATEAMFSLEKKAWDAWKAKDAKGLEDWSSSNLVAFTDKGREMRADAIKTWTTDGCEVKSISLTDPTSVSLGPDHSLLLFRAAVDGKCNGQAIPAMSGATVYAKEAGTWKSIFHAPQM